MLRRLDALAADVPADPQEPGAVVSMLRSRLASPNAAVLVEGRPSRVSIEDGRLVLVRRHPVPTTPRRALGIAMVGALLFTGGLALGGLPDAALATFIAMFMLSRLLPRGLHTAVTAARQCPWCMYDLAGCRPGVPLERVGGIDLGPAACPECGFTWPMVPSG